MKINNLSHPNLSCTFWIFYRMSALKNVDIFSSVFDSHHFFSSWIVWKWWTHFSCFYGDHHSYNKQIKSSDCDACSSSKTDLGSVSHKALMCFLTQSLMWRSAGLMKLKHAAKSPKCGPMQVYLKGLWGWTCSQCEGDIMHHWLNKEQLTVIYFWWNNPVAQLSSAAHRLHCAHSVNSKSLSALILCAAAARWGSLR